jgi:hypothetical protein
MRALDNQTPLPEPVLARSGEVVAYLRTIADAARFIVQLPKKYDGLLHWRLAGAVLEAADRNPENAQLLQTGTRALRNALATDKMLGPISPPEFDQESCERVRDHVAYHGYR